VYEVKTSVVVFPTGQSVTVGLHDVMVYVRVLRIVEVSVWWIEVSVGQASVVEGSSWQSSVEEGSTEDDDRNEEGSPKGCLEADTVEDGEKDDGVAEDDGIEVDAGTEEGGNRRRRGRARRWLRVIWRTRRLVRSFNRSPRPLLLGFVNGV